MSKKYLLMMMMMMNCFCSMVDQRKAFSLISSWDHCQRSSPSRISDMPRAGYHPFRKHHSIFIESTEQTQINTVWFEPYCP